MQMQQAGGWTREVAVEGHVPGATRSATVSGLVAHTHACTMQQPDVAKGRQASTGREAAGARLQTAASHGDLTLGRPNQKAADEQEFRTDCVIGTGCG